MSKNEIMSKNEKKNFVLIGAAGYIAPRHMKAIKEVGGNLVAALDPNDSVGIIDSYFPEADFFTEFERFDRHIEKLRREGTQIDYVSICSPNYLHDSHIRFALRHGADAICEKPLVLNPWNVDALKDIESETSKMVYTILQLRLHPSVIELKRRVDSGPKDKIYDIDLTYITSRGHWYYTSWKGDISKSGGIASNIGVHFFDMLMWVFGSVQENEVHINSHDRAAGFLKLERARVKWFLSINERTLPPKVVKEGKRTYRSILIEGDELEFSQGFTDLHTLSYERIIEGNGYTLDHARNSINLVKELRVKEEVSNSANEHELVKLKKSKHPFEK